MIRMSRLIQLFAVLSLLFCLISTAFGQTPISQSADGLLFSIPPDMIGQAVHLRIGGPGDFSFEDVYEPDQILIAPAKYDLPDGEYRYELSSNSVPQLSAVQNSAQAATEFDEQGRPVSNAARSETTVQAAFDSGVFQIREGLLITPSNEIEPETRGESAWLDKRLAQTRDQVIADDLIVDGSLCVGFDCVNGENFGSDTIRLKENNLRINFQDTSNSGSFPTRDWQIIANDSANGGASFLAFYDNDSSRYPFKVEAAAPDNALYIEDYGRIGAGTSTPVVEFHIKDSDTPTVRLEQDSSGGWTAQTWDVAGNESNFFIRDATNGSKLPFRIQPGTPSSMLTLKSEGRVGIGTWSPEATLHVEGDLLLSSSRELKEDIHELDGAKVMAYLQELKPVSFRYKKSPDEEQLGFIAEDVPQMLTNSKRNAVSPMDFAAFLTTVVKEQQKVVEQQQSIIKDQDARLEALEARLAELESKLAK